jgi:hypothetical protein
MILTTPALHTTSTAWQPTAAARLRSRSLTHGRAAKTALCAPLVHSAACDRAMVSGAAVQQWLRAVHFQCGDGIHGTEQSTVHVVPARSAMRVTAATIGVHAPTHTWPTPNHSSSASPQLHVCPKQPAWHQLGAGPRCLQFIQRRVTKPMVSVQSSLHGTSWAQVQGAFKCCGNILWQHPSEMGRMMQDMLLVCTHGRASTPATLRISNCSFDQQIPSENRAPYHAPKATLKAGGVITDAWRCVLRPLGWRGLEGRSRLGCVRSSHSCIATESVQVGPDRPPLRLHARHAALAAPLAIGLSSKSAAQNQFRSYQIVCLHSVWTEFTVIMVRGSAYPRGMLLVTGMLASSEQAWEPIASSSVNSCRKRAPCCPHI